MPYLKGPNIKKKVKSLKQEVNYYNVPRWEKLREFYIVKHPVCEICEEDGWSIMAQEVHHILPIKAVSDPEEQRKRAYDEGNLLSVCKVCHRWLHELLKKDSRSYFKKIFSAQNDV